MKTRILIFTPGQNEPEEREVALETSYDGLRHVVEPLVARATPKTYMEHVAVLYEGQRRDMFVDEMGAYPGMELPVNLRATEIYWQATLAREKHLTLAKLWAMPHFSRIHGPAVLFPDAVVWR